MRGAPRARRTPPPSGRTWPAPWGSCGRRESGGWGSSARAWAARPPSSSPRRRGPEIDTVVTLSAPDAIDGLTAGPEVVQAVDAAKLFIAGNVDANAAATAQTFYDESVQPKRVEILPTADHGTDLLDGNQGENVRTLIIELAPATRARRMSRPIVFLTDYGTADEFVGVCHGVMLRILPDARIVDLDARDPPPGRDARWADARPRDLVHARRRGLRGGRRSGRGIGTPIDRRSRVLGCVPGRTRQRACCPWRGRRWTAPKRRSRSRPTPSSCNRCRARSTDATCSRRRRRIWRRACRSTRSARPSTVEELHVVELPGPMVARGRGRRPRDRHRRVRQRAVERPATTIWRRPISARS